MKTETAHRMRKSGFRTMMAGVAGVVICVTPILLYMNFGPADGNPIGLGLLMVLGAPLGVVALAAGLVLWLIGKYSLDGAG